MTVASGAQSEPGPLRAETTQRDPFTTMSPEQALTCMAQNVPSGPTADRQQIILEDRTARDVANRTWFGVDDSGEPERPFVWQRGDLDIDGVAVITTEGGPADGEALSRAFQLWAFDAARSHESAPQVLFALWSAGALPHGTRLTFGIPTGLDCAQASLGEAAFTLTSHPGPAGTSAVDHYSWTFTTRADRAMQDGARYSAQRVVDQGEVTRSHEARETALAWLEHARSLADLQQLATALEPEVSGTLDVSAAPRGAFLRVAHHDDVLQIEARDWSEDSTEARRQYVITRHDSALTPVGEPAYVTGVDAAREALAILLAERRRTA